MPAINDIEYDALLKMIRDLELRIERLENQPAPTLPFYDQTNWPEDAVEGQVVIAPITP
jgi:hypothetical protein